ncbi:MAG: hypothetical protein SCM11_03145, partial [Bacillota bacterium]|nr:hypothetical protein [Bacillota bacterium]
MTEMNIFTEAGKTTHADTQTPNQAQEKKHTQEQTQANEKTPAQKLFQIISVLLYAFVFVRLFLWGGWGFGFF